MFTRCLLSLLAVCLFATAAIAAAPLAVRAKGHCFVSLAGINQFVEGSVWNPETKTLVVNLKVGSSLCFTAGSVHFTKRGYLNDSQQSIDQPFTAAIAPMVYKGNFMIPVSCFKQTGSLTATSAKIGKNETLTLADCVGPAVTLNVTCDKSVEINLTKQRFYRYECGLLIDSSRCSTGKGWRLIKPGEKPKRKAKIYHRDYVVRRIDPRGAKARSVGDDSDGDGSPDYDVATPWKWYLDIKDGNKVNIHGYLHVPKYADSKGCIRLIILYAKRISPWMEVGIPAKFTK